MSDSELWDSIKRGDSQAWAELIRRYRKLVYAVAARAGLSMMDAADCFQQTWVLLYRSRNTLRNPDRLSSWLVTTARREALRLRRESSHYTSDVNDDYIDDRDLLPDEELERLERQAQLEAALNELSPRCQEIMEIFFFAPGEKSYEDIARSLGISANSLGPIRRRCLEQLKKILLKKGFPGVRKRR